MDLECAGSECVRGTCVCDADLDPKTNCATLLCENSNDVSDCGGQGTCVNGACICAEQYTGPGCSQQKESATSTILAVMISLIVLVLFTVVTVVLQRHRAIKKLKKQYEQS